MDQQTKAALKQDKFVSTTTHGLEWVGDNRKSVYTIGGIILAIIVVVVLAVITYTSRSESASVAFGTAMQTYQTPLAQPGVPVPPGVKSFTSSVERAKTANALFLDVAGKYGLTPSGQNALYFAGLTYNEAGQTQQGEDTLKKVAGSWNGNLAALAKFALADMYRNASRDPEAITLYNQLIAKPTTTVPAGISQLALADLYTREGKTTDARKIYASLADSDKKGPAGAAAKQKLNPGAPPMQLGQ